ncbi:hypothetical protein [Photobacterium damselae]|uniref:hypothetical protein n=1 Tax=Photobacterium damselae TaxID=38293 RepID=UPI001F5B2B26|nr:hypothetical protein [Photobacterium damselae]
MVTVQRVQELTAQHVVAAATTVLTHHIRPLLTLHMEEVVTEQVIMVQVVRDQAGQVLVHQLFIQQLK